MGPISASASSSATGGWSSGNWDNSGFVVNYKSPQDSTTLYMLAGLAVVALLLWKKK